MSASTVRQIHLRAADCLSTQEADAFAGRHLDAASYDVLVQGESADVYKPDGTPLVLYRHDFLPRRLCRDAYGVLRTVRGELDNRGTAAGSGMARDVLPDGSA